jgi:hypothetical protein
MKVVSNTGQGRQGVERKCYPHYSQAKVAAGSYPQHSDLSASYPDLAGFLFRECANRPTKIEFFNFPAGTISGWRAFA